MTTAPLTRPNASRAQTGGPRRVWNWLIEPPARFAGRACLLLLGLLALTYEYQMLSPIY
jgi:hypothetical protein